MKNNRCFPAESSYFRHATDMKIRRTTQLCGLSRENCVDLTPDTDDPVVASNKKKLANWKMKRTSHFRMLTKSCILQRSTDAVGPRLRLKRGGCCGRKQCLAVAVGRFRWRSHRRCVAVAPAPSPAATTGVGVGQTIRHKQKQRPRATAQRLRRGPRGSSDNELRCSRGAAAPRRGPHRGQHRQRARGSSNNELRCGRRAAAPRRRGAAVRPTSRLPRRGAAARPASATGARQPRQQAAVRPPGRGAAGPRCRRAAAQRCGPHRGGAAARPASRQRAAVLPRRRRAAAQRCDPHRGGAAARPEPRRGAAARPASRQRAAVRPQRRRGAAPRRLPHRGPHRGRCTAARGRCFHLRRIVWRRRRHQSRRPLTVQGRPAASDEASESVAPPQEVSWRLRPCSVYGHPSRLVLRRSAGCVPEPTAATAAMAGRHYHTPASG